MSFAEAFRVQQPDAYERLLLDVVRGNPTLFMRRDEVEAAWAGSTRSCSAGPPRPEAPAGTAGTWGPSAPIALIERDGSTWHEGQPVNTPPDPATVTDRIIERSSAPRAATST